MYCPQEKAHSAKTNASTFGVLGPYVQPCRPPQSICSLCLGPGRIAMSKVLG